MSTATWPGPADQDLNCGANLRNCHGDTSLDANEHQDSVTSQLDLVRPVDSNPNLPNLTLDFFMIQAIWIKRFCFGCDFSQPFSHCPTQRGYSCTKPHCHYDFGKEKKIAVFSLVFLN